jgi:arylsulfatase A-like enzyme
MPRWSRHGRCDRRGAREFAACGLEERTLIFFLSDNGGAQAEVTGASNAPLRGVEGRDAEGHSGAVAQWKEGFPRAASSTLR